MDVGDAAVAGEPDGPGELGAGPKTGELGESPAAGEFDDCEASGVDCAWLGEALPGTAGTSLGTEAAGGAWLGAGVPGASGGSLAAGNAGSGEPGGDGVGEGA